MMSGGECVGGQRRIGGCSGELSQFGCPSGRCSGELTHFGVRITRRGGEVDQGLGDLTYLLLSARMAVDSRKPRCFRLHLLSARGEGWPLPPNLTGFPGVGDGR